MRNVLLMNSCFQTLRAYGKCGRARWPRAMSSYQVLDKLPQRDHLLRTPSAISAVSRSLMRLASYKLVEYHYVTATNLFSKVASILVEPEHDVCAFYQLTSKSLGIHHIAALDTGAHTNIPRIGLFDEANNLVRSMYDDAIDKEEVEECRR